MNAFELWLRELNDWQVMGVQLVSGILGCLIYNGLWLIRMNIKDKRFRG